MLAAPVLSAWVTPRRRILVLVAVAAALAAAEALKQAVGMQSNGGAPSASFSEAAWRYAHRTRGMRG